MEEYLLFLYPWHVISHGLFGGCPRIDLIDIHIVAGSGLMQLFLLGENLRAITVIRVESDGLSLVLRRRLPHLFAKQPCLSRRLLILNEVLHFQKF